MRSIASLSAKALMLGAALFVATQASAQVWPTVPGDTAPDGPWPDSAVPAGAGNGGLIVSAWDAVRGVSLIQYLGLNYNDVGPDDLENPLGGTLDFGVLDQWSSVFGESDPANVVYHVHAARLDAGALSARRIIVTGPTTGVGNAQNSNPANAALASRNFITLTGVTPACVEVNPCIATANDQQQYAGLAAYGDRLNGALLFMASAPVGTALGFYEIVPTSNVPTVRATVHQYANASGIGTWLLTSAGALSYSIPGGSTVVPLPAAMWLLLSGLVGFGAVARRKHA